MILSEEEYLAHYGVLRRSGRYPWGSGGPENASNKGFLDYVEELRGQGLSEVEIARGMGIVDRNGNPSTTQLRAARSIANTEEKLALISQLQRMRDKGVGYVAIGKRMNMPESTVRSLLAPGAADKVKILHTTADMLKQEVAKKKYVDVGRGAENSVKISSNKLRTAVALLQEQGYQINYIKHPQAGQPGQFTRMKVLTAPGTSYGELSRNRDKIQQLTNISDDGGRSYVDSLEFSVSPVKIHPNRVGVVYAEQGGDKADGVIFVRPGVKDVSLGMNRYAQV